VTHYVVTEHDAHELNDDDLARSCVLAGVAHAENYPDDPTLPRAAWIAGERALPARVRAWEFRAWAPDSSLVGTAVAQIDPDHDETADLLRVTLFVLPEHRGRGAGSALLERVVECARSQQRTRISGWTTSGAPSGEAFAAARGARVVTRGHINHLPVGEIDRPELERWVEDGPRRAPGYSLLAWDGPCPDEYLDAFADVYDVMNDAPLDDLVVADSSISADFVREWERFVTARGGALWTVVARAPDGDFAGFHNVNWKASRPTVLEVEDTGVHRDHRGRALGKWLKAWMTLRILDQRPTVTDIRTGNADSNAAMLGINVALGYRPLLRTTTWELAVDD
jgi:GNAT superfamily N-acetyltransferase